MIIQQIRRIIEGLKTFLENKTVTSDKQMLSVIFNLVKKVMGNIDEFDEQISLLNNVNNYIIRVDKLEDDHLVKIIKINSVLHSNYKEKYETSVNSDFLNFVVTIIGQKQKSMDIIKMMASFIESITKFRTKPFEIKDALADLLINQSIFDEKTRLNLIKNFMKLYSNTIILLRNKLLTFIMKTIKENDNLVRTRAVEVVKYLNEGAQKKPDIRASLREVSMRYPECSIFTFVIGVLQGGKDYGVEYEQALVGLLKIISLDRSLKDFQEIMVDIQNVEGYIKNIADKSHVTELRKLFSLIYEQMSKNWTIEQKDNILDTMNGGNTGDENQEYREDTSD